MQLSRFEDIVVRVLHFEKGSDGELKVKYLKDVSVLLSLVSAVCECNNDQAERNMIIYLLLMPIKIMRATKHIKMSTYPISNK